MPNRVVFKREVCTKPGPTGWRLCFQWCVYVYETGETQEGFRFIWRRPDGSLQPARGQARIPSSTVLQQLISEADKEGWLQNIAEDADDYLV